MRIPLADLERVRRNPSAYRKLYESARRRPVAPQPQAHKSNKVASRDVYPTLMRSVSEFHRSDGELEYAQNYLRQICPPKKRRKELPALLDQLKDYADNFLGLKNTVIRRRDRLILPLPNRFNQKLQITGLIPRVDLTKTGYFTAWLFIRKEADWKSELRMPLIQMAYSKCLDAQTDEVTVGVYNFSTRRCETYQFNDKQIARAEKELLRLLKQVAFD